MKIFSRGNMLRCDLNNVRFHTPAITKNSSNYNSFSDGSGMSNLTYFSISIHCQQHVVMMFVLTDSQCSDCTALHVVARHLCTRVNIPQAERPTVMGCDYGVKRPDGKNTHHLGGVLKTDGISIAISLIYYKQYQNMNIYKLFTVHLSVRSYSSQQHNMLSSPTLKKVLSSNDI